MILLSHIVIFKFILIYCGGLFIYFKFFVAIGSGCPPTGELHIWLREIVGLLPTKRGAPSTYVKRCVCTFIVDCCLIFVVISWAHQYGLCLYSVVLPDESGVNGQQTRLVRGSVNPVFNHTMVYDGFQSSDLIQACAEITVWSPHPSSCLGGVRVSTGSGNTDLNIMYLAYKHS